MTAHAWLRERFRLVAIRRDLTQRELARACGRSAVTLYRAGLRRVSVPVADGLVRAQVITSDEAWDLVRGQTPSASP